ncbi:hypothetical protein [Methanobrevibacter sp.]|uniref:hypothetical protein n=1 Tax=Methanobrevibacter sp. TaxID=66852 RepID=UPI0026E02006|nr:hypothetical protein [Methanobrevibacter sp.]MDO5859439.1 hypothetical protein [Methanobrevibacter sp.]
MDFKKILIIAAILMILGISLSAVSAEDSSSPIKLGKINSYNVTSNSGSSFTFSVEISLDDLSKDDEGSLASATFNDNTIDILANFTIDGKKVPFNETSKLSSLDIGSDKLSFEETITLPASSSSDIKLDSVGLGTSQGIFVSSN